MSTNKSKSADKGAVKQAAQADLNCFPKAKLEQALEALAAGKTAQGEAATSAASASLELARIAAEYSTEAHAKATKVSSKAASHGVVMGDWRDNMRLVALELAASGSPFAESSTNKAGETVGKLTGTGNNVMSIAKGVVDFELDIDADCKNEDGEVSYRSVRATVEAKRAERRAQENPEAAKLAAAKESAREAWKALSKIIFDTDDIELIETLTESLESMAEAETKALEIAAEIEAEKAATEAEAA
jgi:hypothetical protein